MRYAEHNGYTPWTRCAWADTKENAYFVIEEGKDGYEYYFESCTGEPAADKGEILDAGIVIDKKKTLLENAFSIAAEAGWSRKDMVQVNMDAVEKLPRRPYPYVTAWTLRDDFGMVYQEGLSLKNMMDYVRSVSGKQELYPDPVSLDRMINEPDFGYRFDIEQDTVLTLFAKTVDPKKYSVTFITHELQKTHTAFSDKRTEGMLDAAGYNEEDLVQGLYEPDKCVELFGRSFRPVVEFSKINKNRRKDK